MKDKFGHQRGSCRNCIDCQEFLSTQGETRCTRCGCTPVAHEKILVVIPLKEDKDEDMQIDSSSSSHLQSSTTQDNPVACPVVLEAINKPVVQATTNHVPVVQAQVVQAEILSLVQATTNHVPVVQAPVVQAPVVQAPVVQGPVVQGPVVQAPVVQAPVVQAPVVQAPVVQTPVVQGPVVQAPVVQTPVVQGPVVQAPVVQAPVVQAPVVQAPTKPVVQATTCNIPGCTNDVDFDLDTGIEYPYCSVHTVNDMIMTDLTTDEQEMIIPTLMADTPELMIVDENYEYQQTTAFIRKCALMECTKPCYIDEYGAMYECCGYTHAKEYQRRQSLGIMVNTQPALSFGDGASAVPPLVAKCALSDCTNACHVDDNGKVHECCSFSHAMEHQRRLSLMKQDISQNIVKGVTHCLLPECNNIVWPFQNYCGKTHADIGTKRGLTVTTAGNSDDPNSCIYPNCNKLKFTDPNGTVHPYCGKTHANLAKSLGIFPKATSSDDECQLEGCNRPKLREGKRVHDYCSAEHAKKDEPNRQVLTPLSKVKEFLKQFESTFKVVSLEENDHAKPGGALFKKFKDKMMSLPKDQRKTCLAFHGTAANNIQSICQNGYNPALRKGQACGPGEYFAKNPTTSLAYCRSGKKMLLNELLLGQQGADHTQHGDIIVMKDPIHDLPRFVITFQ